MNILIRLDGSEARFVGNEEGGGTSHRSEDDGFVYL